MSTLAGTTAILVGTKPALTEDARLMKSELQIYADNLPDDEVVFIGMANGDISLADIQASLNINGPLFRQDYDRNEPVFRNVRILGMIRGRGANLIAPIEGSEGQVGFLTDMFPWTYGKTVSWNYFVWNPTTTALAGGATVSVHAKHYGVWVK